MPLSVALYGRWLKVRLLDGAVQWRGDTAIPRAHSLSRRGRVPRRVQGFLSKDKDSSRDERRGTKEPCSEGGRGAGEGGKGTCAEGVQDGLT